MVATSVARVAILLGSAPSRVEVEHPVIHLEEEEGAEEEEEEEEAEAAGEG